MKSGGIDEDELRILYCRDGKFGFIDGGDAVACRNPLPVDEDHALGGGEIGMPKARRRRVSKGGPGKERGAQHARIGPDHQRPAALWISARQLDQAPGAIRLRKLAGVPTGRPAALTRKKPDLEQLEWVFVAVVLGMTDSGSCAHDLDVTSHGPTDIAGTVFMRDGALADMGYDFHVRMRVATKTGAGRDLVIVPDHECAEGAIRRIAVGRNDEVVARLQPAAIAVIERLFGSKLQHDHSSISDSMGARLLGIVMWLDRSRD